MPARPLTLTRLLSALVLAAGTALGAVAVGPATSAGAVTPVCNGTTAKSYGGFYVTMPTYNGSVTCDLYRGVQGSSVSRLQYHLNKCYSRGLAQDGSYGPATEDAVQYVQRVVGVDDDGDYGPITRSRMKFWGYSFVNGNPVYSCRVVG